MIEISDDGAGMTEDVLAKVRRSLSDSSTGFYSDSQQSIGLANVYTRLKLCYQRQAVLDVDSEPEVGTVISLKLPFYFNHQGIKNMIRTILCEDEYWVRKGLIRQIPWDRYGLELAGEFSNSSQAVSL